MLSVILKIFIGAWLVTALVAVTGYVAGVLIERDFSGRWQLDPRRWRLMDIDDD
jgi:hypothetical protein